MLLGFVAMALDGGLLLAERKRSRNTADAAAMAAACVLYEKYPWNNGVDVDGTAAAAAFAVAADNGYTNDGVHSKVEVNIPPLNGPYKGLPGYTEVIVTYYETRAFSHIFGSDPLPVRGRAVSRGAWVSPNIGVLVLQYTGKGTLTDQGSGYFTESGAPIIVNSNNASAALDTGGGTLIATEVDVTGGYVTSGGGTITTTPIPNNIFTGVPPTPDPFRYLPQPGDPGGPPIPPAGTVNKTPLGSGNFRYDLYPGSYSNLPNFSQGDVVIFHQASSNGNGGIFYLTAGGLNSNGANLLMGSNESGGVMFFNAGTGTNDKINIAGNSSGTVNLGPLTSGPYAGFTFWQNRASSEQLNLQGQGAFTIDGTIYAATALLSVSGTGNGDNIGSSYVSGDLSISGSGNVNIAWAGAQQGRTRIITLVE
jgi:hypothetical protein